MKIIEEEAREYCIVYEDVHEDWDDEDWEDDYTPEDWEDFREDSPIPPAEAWRFES